MQDHPSSASREPRRSARVPARSAQTKAVPTPILPSTPRKRKFRDLEADEQLEYLFKNPDSPLTMMNLSNLVNFENWNGLPPDSRVVLSVLLPPTAFIGFQASIDPHHPSCRNSTHSDDGALTAEGASGPLIPSPDQLDPSFFTDPHFLAATHTFQDHLCSGWMSDDHLEKVEFVQRGIRDGSLHAPWKDEEWEMNNVPATLPQISRDIPQRESSARAGDAAGLKLFDLAKNSILKVGDIIAYKRNFTNLNLVVEKDVIVQSIHPKTFALTVLLEPGTMQNLSASLVSRDPMEPTMSTREMVISTPSMLETGLLDVDGRVDRSKRPNANAWKNFTVWRWPELPAESTDEGPDARGNRQNHGTLFYIRGCYFHDR